MARTIYLLHFDRPFSHARHYMGSAEDLDCPAGRARRRRRRTAAVVGPAGWDRLDAGEDLVPRSQT